VPAVVISSDPSHATTVGHVARLCRYPVKSLAGETLDHAFVGFAGVYGDRMYAVRRAGARKGYPYLVAGEQPQMLRYRPAFRHPERMATPPNLAEADAIAVGVTPLYAEAGEAQLDVHTPDGDVLAIDDPRLLDRLRPADRGDMELGILRSDRALTDCRPISLIALETIAQLEAEIGIPLDPRRFRANVYLRLGEGAGFAEDGWVGRRLRLGSKAEIVVVERDPRCKMITLDPDTGAATPEVMRRVAKDHDSNAGVYAAVVVEGVVRAGDAVTLVG
jgi:uncharacterized protein YcbX